MSHSGDQHSRITIGGIGIDSVALAVPGMIILSKTTQEYIYTNYYKIGPMGPIFSVADDLLSVLAEETASFKLDAYSSLTTRSP